MSTSLGSLVVEMSANMAQFQSDMGKAAHIAQQNMEKVNKAAEMAKRGLEGLGIGLGIHEFAEMIKGTLEAADQLGKMSQKVGMSVEALSSLKYSADLSDISMDQLGIGLTHLSKNMLLTEQAAAKLINSTGALGSIPVGAAAAFQQMNINVEASKGHLKSSDQVLMEVADRFSHMRDGALKTGLAMQIFGKSGAAMIPLLNQGSTAFKAQHDELKRLGGLMSAQMTKDAEEVNDNMKRLQHSSEGVKIALAKNIVGPLNETAKAMVDYAEQGKPYLALLRGFEGLGKIPFDLAWPAENFTVESHIKDLKKQLVDLEIKSKQSAGGGLLKELFFGDKNDLDHQILIIKNQMEAFQKFGDKLGKPKEKDKPDQTDPALAEANAMKQKTLIDKSIAGYKSLSDVTRSAWQESLKSEKDYLDMSKSLHAQAEAAKPKDMSAEGQAMAGVDVTIAKMKLSRLAYSSGTAYDDIKKQAELVRALAGNLLDQSAAQKAVAESYETESKAAASAAIAQKQQTTELRDQWNKAVQTVADLKTAKESLGMPTAINIQSEAAQITLGNIRKGWDGLSDKVITLTVLSKPGLDTIMPTAPGHAAISSPALPSFAVGTDFVPRDMIAKIHQGERIVPASENNRNMVPLNVTIPGIGTYPMSATNDVAVDLQTAVRRAALKYGNT